MTPTENPLQDIHIKDFLTVSRKYLSLNKRTCVTKQRSLTASLPSTYMNTCRKVAQSFLLAAGVGAFAAAPAMADDLGCGYKGGNTERHAKMMEQHHTRLHDALKLTAEQEPAWKKLLESEQPRPALSGGKPEDWAQLNAPERAEKMLEVANARQVQMAEHVAALKAFYATLTPEQQKTFEDFHAGPRGGMSGKSGAKASSTTQVPGKP